MSDVADRRNAAQDVVRQLLSSRSSDAALRKFIQVHQTTTKELSNLCCFKPPQRDARGGQIKDLSAKHSFPKLATLVLEGLVLVPYEVHMANPIAPPWAKE